MLSPILATEKLFYTHGFQTLLIVGILAFLAGLIYGWYLWRRCKVQADRLIAANAHLENELRGIDAEINSLDEQVKAFEKAA